MLDLELSLPLPKSVRGPTKASIFSDELRAKLAEEIPDLQLRDFPRDAPGADGLFVLRPSPGFELPGVSVCALMALPDPKALPPPEELGRAIGARAKPLFVAAATSVVLGNVSKTELKKKARAARLKIVLERFHALLGPELAALKADLGLKGKPKPGAGGDDDWSLAWLACGETLSLRAEHATWRLDPRDEDGDIARGKGEAIQIDVRIPAPPASAAEAWGERIRRAFPALPDVVVGFPNEDDVAGNRAFVWAPVKKVAELEGCVDVCLRSKSADTILPDDVPAIVEAMLPAWPAFCDVVDYVRGAVDATPARATREAAIDLLGEAAFVLQAPAARALRWEGSRESHDVLVDDSFFEVRSLVDAFPVLATFTPRELALGAAHEDRWHVARIALPRDDFERAWAVIAARSEGLRARPCGDVLGDERASTVMRHLVSALGMKHLVDKEGADFWLVLEDLLARARVDVIEAPFANGWRALAAGASLLAGPARLILRR